MIDGGRKLSSQIPNLFETALNLLTDKPFCLFHNRYNHDSSETVEDDIEFIATDNTNSVRFVLQVKVIPHI